MKPSAAIAASVHELEKQVRTIASTQQLASSTVGDTEDAQVAVSDTIADAAVTADAIPDLQDGISDADEATSDLTAILQANEDDLDARFADAAVDLQLAQAQLDEAQQKLDDAFIDIGDLGTATQANADAARAASAAAAAADAAATSAGQAAAAAQSTADTAQTNAATANQAALDAAGLAASKGEVIRQPSAPTGSRANPANLWVNTTPDANGNPKNTPNLYNTSTSKWEPVTDQKVIDAANAATAAASAAATAQSTADAAKNSAQTAQTAAQGAQSTADQAQQTAGTAASNAQAAIVSAAAAQTTADQAKINATTAQGAADAAKTSATAAQARADLAAFATFSSERDSNKWDSWLRAVYPIATASNTVPSYALVLGTAPAASEYVADSGTLANSLGDNYVGLLRSIVRVDAAKTITATLTHDDGARFYVDGVSVYQAAAYTSGVTVSFSLSAGWHVIDLLWAEQGGGDGISGISPTFRSQVAEMYAPVSLQSRAADATAALKNAATAQTAADQAKTNAATAQSTADTAKANAKTAQTSADSAGQAAAAAQSTADQAKSNAATAQTAADSANSAALAAAGLAASKGETIYQKTAPSGSRANTANLWVDITPDAFGVPKNTPNRYVDYSAIVDPSGVAQIATSANIGTERVVDGMILSNLPVGVQIALNVALYVSMAQNSVVKGTIARVRDGGVDGPILGSYTYSDKGDSTAGDAERWDFGTYVTPTTSTIVVTIQSTNASRPDVFSSRRLIAGSVSKWVPITDQKAIAAAAAAAAAKTAADNAATAASNAQQTANQAASAAAAAQATATGKPQILFGTGTPAGTAPLGSTWFQVDSSGSVIGQWQQTDSSNTGSTWTARLLRSEVIANLDVGKLTVGTAAIVDAVVQKIAAATANIQTANIANLFVTSGATMAQATIDALYAQVVNAYKITASMIDVGTLNGVTLTGTVVQTAASGKRAVLSGASTSYYDSNDKLAGYVQGSANGAGGGLLAIGPSQDGSAGLLIGKYYLPLGGTANMRGESAYISTLYVDQVVDPSSGDRFQGTYRGTRTQLIGNATISGIGAFTTPSGVGKSFLTMNDNGTFTLIPGAYVLNAVMTLTGAKATGRTFVELIDMNDSLFQPVRANMTPNVGEDTVSTSGTVDVPSARTFRVQCYQTSGNQQNVRFALAVTRVG